MKALLTAVAAAVGLAVASGGTAVQAEGVVQSAADDVMISLVHGIPDTTVDVQIGESIVINAFRPGSIADISAFMGRTLEDVSLVDDESGEVLLGPIAALEVPLTGSWSLVAHLDELGEPVITPFENDRSGVAAGTARLTFRHTAESPAVDLVLGDQRPVSNASNGDSAVIEVPDGTLSNAQIAPAGEAPAVSIAALDLAPQTNTIIYAIGSLDDGDLDFVVQVLALAGSAPTTSTASAAVTTTTEAAPATTQPPATTAPATTAPETTAVDNAAAESETTAPTPTGVATGAPIGSASQSLLLATVAGLVLAGGAFAARRRL